MQESQVIATLLVLALAEAGALIVFTLRRRSMRRYRQTSAGALAEIEAANLKITGLHAELEREKIAFTELQRQMLVVERKLSTLPPAPSPQTETRDAEQLLRTFNQECDAVLEAIKLPGSAVMDPRLHRMLTAVGGLSDVVQIAISREFLAARLAEIRRSGRKSD